MKEELLDKFIDTNGDRYIESSIGSESSVSGLTVKRNGIKILQYVNQWLKQEQKMFNGFTTFYHGHIIRISIYDENNEYIYYKLSRLIFIYKLKCKIIDTNGKSN